MSQELRLPSNRDLCELFFFRYFDSDSEFPAVIYSSDDVLHPHLHHQGHHHGQHCQSHHLHLKTRERWMKDAPYSHLNQSHKQSLLNKFESLPESSHFHNGILTVNSEPVPSSTRHLPSKKQRRASGDYYDKKKTTCMLYLQADHLFYEKMGRSEEACIDVMTRHVQRVNSIYRAVGETSTVYEVVELVKINFEFLTTYCWSHFSDDEICKLKSESSDLQIWSEEEEL